MTNYRDSQGQVIQLKNRIARKGEGEVWKTSRNGYLAKIYIQQPTSDRINKLRVMLAHPPNDPTSYQSHTSIAWPKELLIDNSGACVGFLMPAITQAQELIKVYSPQHRLKLAPEFNWRYLHMTAQNIALIVKELHASNYIIGDMKQDNFLVNNQGLVSIVDTDSFQIIDPKTKTIHRCPVGSEEFTPPELIGKDFRTVTQTKSHDNFRLGIVIHLLLFGYNPFAIGTLINYDNQLDLNERIRNNLSIYNLKNQFKLPESIIPLKVLHPEIQKLFLQCFNDGHKNPNLRPSAEDWLKALKLAFSELTQCNKVGNHFYSRASAYGKCYWCDQAVKSGRDIFPSKGSQNKNPFITQPSVPKTKNNFSPIVTVATQVTVPNTQNNLSQQSTSQNPWGWILSVLFLLLTFSWCSSQSFHQSKPISVSNNFNSSPEKFVEDYYSAINNYEYLLAWNRLSSKFQSRKSLMPNGYSSYLSWWRKVTHVKIHKVISVSKSSETSQVDVELQYLMKSGRKVSHNLRLLLLWDTKRGMWIIDDSKRL